MTGYDAIKLFPFVAGVTILVFFVALVIVVFASGMWRDLFNKPNPRQ